MQTARVDDLVTFSAKGVVVLKSARESVQVAREWITGALANWPDDVVNDAVQIVSELVTNAVEHADTRDILVQAFAGVLNPTIEVWDWDLTPPVLREADFLAESGRGMNIVNTLAQSWGCVQGRHSKAVWAVLNGPSL